MRGSSARDYFGTCTSVASCSPVSGAGMYFDFITKDSIDPVRIIGLEDMMGDAVKFKYIPAPLTGEQLVTLVQVPK